MIEVDYRSMYLKVRDELAELQQREWVGLTDEEIDKCIALAKPTAIAEEVEAKLKEKNT